MKRRKLIYDFIRAGLEFIDWLWLHHWRYVLLAGAVVAGVVWGRGLSQALQ